VKNALRSIAVSLLIVVYAFAVGHSSLHSDLHQSKTHTDESSTFKNIVDSWLSSASGNESSYSNSLRFYFSGEKNLNTDFVILLKKAARYFQTYFIQYTFFEKNLIERLFPQDIIFPFHYFW